MRQKTQKYNNNHNNQTKRNGADGGFGGSPCAKSRQRVRARECERLAKGDRTTETARAKEWNCFWISNKYMDCVTIWFVCRCYCCCWYFFPTLSSYLYRSRIRHAHTFSRPCSLNSTAIFFCSFLVLCFSLMLVNIQLCLFNRSQFANDQQKIKLKWMHTKHTRTHIPSNI